ncbi:kinase-like domain-containing protein [Mycena sp. CBHHK59/15]|nr:kinase-like domain-containing protein [Mycena sp. CBHHK59/15]
MSETIPELTGQFVDDGRLQLLQIIGTGAFGVVYKALDAASPPDAPIHYAVKCIGKVNPSDHKYIVTLHRTFTHEAYQYIVLDLCTSGTLHDAIRKGVFRGKPALVKQVFLQVLDVVRHCHDRGIYHRDLKPDKSCLPCSDACGTIPYMTPETLTIGTKTHAYEPFQSDVWALCIILLELISGTRPWRCADYMDPSWRAFIARDDHLRAILPISAPLHQLLNRCFTPDTPRRPGLLDLRLAIAGIQELYMAPANLAARPVRTTASSSSQLQSYPSFDSAEYPSAESEASSISFELHPVRASQLQLCPAADADDSLSVLESPGPRTPASEISNHLFRPRVVRASQEHLPAVPATSTKIAPVPIVPVSNADVDISPLAARLAHPKPKPLSLDWAPNTRGTPPPAPVSTATRSRGWFGG